MPRKSNIPRQQRPIDQRIERLAGRQHWVVAARQLLRMEIPRSTIDDRVRRGRLVPIRRGVYKLGPAPLTLRGELATAVLTATPTPLVGCETATGLWGLAPLRVRPIHLTSTGGASRSRGDIVIHRSASLHPDDHDRHDGLPVTSVARTLVDIAGGDPDYLRRAVEEADKENLLVVSGVLAACERARGRSGIPALRALVSALTAPEPTIEEMERRFLWLCRDRMPRELQPEINSEVAGWQVDAYWPRARLAVELDSVEHHSHRSQVRRDLRKNLDLADAGIDLIRLGWIEVNAEAARTAAMLLRRLSESAVILG